MNIEIIKRIVVNDFIKKVDSKESVIGIMGLGYVGLPLAIRFSDCGFKVIGFDVDKTKIENINNGKYYIEHIDSNYILSCVEQGFSATSVFSDVSDCDALIMCVPTPLNIYREPDLTYIESTIESMLPYLRKNQLISLESTTYPGTTDEVIATKIESLDFEVGEDIFLVYSPEREDPGNKIFNTESIPKIIGGKTEKCLEAGFRLYSSVIGKMVKVRSTKVAEMTKLLENIYRSVNIGLVNEMKILADKMDIDIFEVIDAAKTKPFGFTPFYPGPGLGGHCIPIDPFYLTWKAREYGIHTRFIELAGEINTQMPQYVIDRLSASLNLHGKPVYGSKILILGLAYKKNVDDMRESPSLEILESLKGLGADISYNDPYFKKFPPMRNYSFDLTSVDLTKDVLNSFDAVILVTDHDDYDYQFIEKNSKLIVDTRGSFPRSAPNVVRA